MLNISRFLLAPLQDQCLPLSFSNMQHFLLKTKPQDLPRGHWAGLRLSSATALSLGKAYSTSSAFPSANVPLVLRTKILQLVPHTSRGHSQAFLRLSLSLSLSTLALCYSSMGQVEWPECCPKMTLDVPNAPCLWD